MLNAFSRLQVVVTTPLAEWIAAVVERCGHEAVIIDPRAARHLVRSKKKTDARDARTLAELARTGWYVAVARKPAVLLWQLWVSGEPFDARRGLAAA